MIRAALALVLAALTLTGSPVAQARDGSPRDEGLPAGTLAVGKRALAPAGETYDPGHFVWARGTRLHDAATVTDFAPWRIEEMQRTPHGYFLRVSRPRRDDYRTAWWDGHLLTWIGWSPSLPEVSPDGRLAGWVDRGGPMIRYGRAGRVVVVDLETGRVVFSTSRWMGKDTDLYEEIFPAFYGFDAHYAYWLRVVGDVRRVRTDLTTWATTPAATAEHGYETPVGLPLDPYTGAPVVLLEGRPSVDGAAVEPGFVSADGRFAFNTSTTARLTITDATTGARVDPEWDSRWRWFAGWQDADTVYVAIPRRFSYSWRPHDRTPVRIAACDLPDGRCTTVTRLRGVAGLVLGSGPS